MIVIVDMEGQDPQKTDTHWRSKGEAEWFWRSKFQVTVRPRVRLASLASTKRCTCFFERKRLVFAYGSRRWYLFLPPATNVRVLQLPSRFQRLSLRLFDRDMLNSNDVICESVLNLRWVGVRGSSRDCCQGGRGGGGQLSKRGIGWRLVGFLTTFAYPAARPPRHLLPVP